MLEKYGHDHLKKITRNSGSLDVKYKEIRESNTVFMYLFTV